MARVARAGARVPRRPRARARGRSPSATAPSCAISRARSSGIADARSLGRRRTRREKLRAEALRVLRPGSEAVLPRGRGARRPVPRRRDALRRRASRRRRRRCGIRTCASSTIRDARGRAASASSTSTSTRATSKRSGAWMDDAIDRRRMRRARADAGRLSHLQLLARRSAASPRCFTHDDVITLFHEFGHGLHHLLTRSRRPRRVRHQRRRVGRGRAAEPVHGELRLGVGRAAAHDARTSTRGEPLPRELFDKHARREELPERPADRCASSSSRCSTCACTRDYDPAARRRVRSC